jgi:DNA-binding response OmpR family regulator
VAITLLAVDDSVTMRKVLEITFASPDFRVVTANSADAALQKFRTDKPDMVISDITLDPKSGYELCKAVKQLSPATPVLLLSSKQNPFDAGKGTAAQADDHMDKPFDTQQMIEKVKKMLQNRAEAPAAKPATAAAPPPTGTSPAARPTTSTQPTAPAAAAGAGAAPVQRAKTLIYNPPAGAPAQPAAPAATAAAKPAAPGVTAPAGGAKPGPSPTPPAGLPRQRTVALGGGSPASPSPPAVTSAAPSAAAAVALNGQMAAKLEGIGLTPAQVDAVLALSREVVERVVWEVVPVLAETIIKEEIARLTK